MRRIMIIGCAGAGKSTLASRLGAALHLPVIHLDALYWRSGWVESDMESFEQSVLPILQMPNWIIDGNYSGSREARMAACDTVIFLDRGPLVCLGRVLLRWWRHRGRTRPDMAAGCDERLTVEFLRYVWTYRSARRPRVLARLAELQRHKSVFILRSDRDIERFLEKLGKTELMEFASSRID